MRSMLILALATCGPKQSAPPTEPLPVSHPVEAAKPSKKAPAKAEAAKPEAVKAEAAKAEAEPEGTDAQRFVAAHNAMRAKHCAAPLTWSKKLADIAQNWANQLRAKGCVFGHSGGQQYGENLAAGTIGALDPEATVAMWYDEIKLYKFPKGGFSMQTGHLTQLLWRSTKQVGCGHVQCKGNDIYVCNYDPPGNWEGQYRAEVLPASCKK